MNLLNKICRLKSSSRSRWLPACVQLTGRVVIRKWWQSNGHRSLRYISRMSLALYPYYAGFALRYAFLFVPGWLRV